MFGRRSRPTSRGRWSWLRGPLPAAERSGGCAGCGGSGRCGLAVRAAGRPRPQAPRRAAGSPCSRAGCSPSALAIWAQFGLRPVGQRRRRARGRRAGRARPDNSAHPPTSTDAWRLHRLADGRRAPPSGGACGVVSCPAAAVARHRPGAGDTPVQEVHKAPHPPRRTGVWRIRHRGGTQRAPRPPRRVTCGAFVPGAGGTRPARHDGRPEAHGARRKTPGLHPGAPPVRGRFGGWCRARHTPP